MKQFIAVIIAVLLAAVAPPLLRAGVESTDPESVEGGGGGGGGTPGGSDTQVQFNDATTFGGDAGLVYNKTTDLLTGFNITATTSITNSALTAGRLVFSGTAGLQVDDADLSFATDTLTATKMAPTLFTSTFDVANADTTVSRFGAGQLSIEGVEVPTISSSSTLSNKTFSTATLTTGQSFILGASTLGVIGASTVLTPDGPNLYTGTTPNSWHIKEFGDAAHDSNNGSCGVSACADPTLIIHSHNQTTTEWIDIKHDGTNGSIATGAGILKLLPTGAGIGVPIGSTSVPSIAGNTATSTGINITGTPAMFGVVSGAAAWATTGTLFGLSSTISFGWSSGAVDSVALDTFLTREATATVQFGLDVNGAAVAQAIKAHDGITGTDIAGANMRISGGRGTGAGAGGNFSIQSSPSLATGTTAQTLADRIVVVAKPKALTAGAATSVVLFAVASSTVGGGEIEYTVTANDSTDFQIRAGRVGYVMVNKAGTETCKVFGIDSVLGVAGTENPNQTQDASGIGAISSGTLTYTWGTDTTGSNTCALTLNAASSLTETTLEIAYTVYRQHGTGTITPQ